MQNDDQTSKVTESGVAGSALDNNKRTGGDEEKKLERMAVVCAEQHAELKEQDEQIERLQRERQVLANDTATLEDEVAALHDRVQDAEDERDALRATQAAQAQFILGQQQRVRRLEQLVAAAQPPDT